MTSTTPAKLTMVAMALAILPWPYGFYTFLKLVAFVAAIYYIHSGRAREKNWLLISAAILFNPVIPVHLFMRSAWILVDLATIWLFWSVMKDIEVRT